MSATVSSSSNDQPNWYATDGTALSAKSYAQAWTQAYTEANQNDPGAALDHSSYSSGSNLATWSGVAGADPGGNPMALEQQLNRPIAAAQALSDNWSNWGLGNGVSLSDPPQNLPPQGQAAIQYINDNPALASALGASDGTVQKSNVDAFVSTAKQQAQTASEAVSTWKKNNPDADPQSQALVQSAGILMANQSLAAGGNGRITASGLSALGQQNPGLSPALTGAGTLWAQPGMFGQIDTAGGHQADSSSIGAWINQDAPTSDAAFANTLNQAALQSSDTPQGYTDAMQSLAGADSSVHGAMQDYFANSIQTGQALNSDIAAQGPTAGLETFVAQTGVYNAALGSNGQPLGLTNPTTGPDGQTGPSALQQYVQHSGQEPALQQQFSSEIVNGKMLTDSVNNGTDLTTALNQYSGAVAAYGLALDPGFTAQNAGELQQNYPGAASHAIFASPTPNDLAVAFGGPDGQFDPAKAQDVLQQMQQQQTPSQPQSSSSDEVLGLTPDKIVNLAKQSFDLVRNGVKVQDSFSKVTDKVSAPKGQATDAYKSGSLHMLSALMGGGVLAAKIAEGGGSATADASIAGTAAQMVGTMTEGAAKWGATSKHSPFSKNGAVPDTVKTKLKSAEHVGKTLGGAGGALSGGLNIVSGVDDLKQGDVAAGVMNLAVGAAGALSGIGSLFEGGTGLFGAKGKTLDRIAAGSSVLGLAGTAVGVLGTLGYGAYEAVEDIKNDTQSS